MTSLLILVGMRLPVDLQVCTHCRIAKALDEFSPDTRCKSGRTSRCKACNLAIWRERFEPAKRPTLRERFERFLEPYPDPTDCWEWQGPKTPAGYGYMWKGLKAHRVSYALLVGPIPLGLTLDHLCFNTSCVNPAHLEPVTRSENVRRARFRQEFLRRIAA